MLLAGKGYRVLLVDKASFAGDAGSGQLVWPPGVARLERWGLLDDLVASNCPPIVDWVVDVGPFPLTGAPPPADGVVEAYCPRRTVLDTILVGAAVGAGAELREEFSVHEILADDDRVTGIRGRAKGGAMVDERARIVVGADGMRSLLARSVDAAIYDARPSSTCAYHTYWSGVAVKSGEAYLHDGQAVFALPASDGLVLVVVIWPHAAFQAVRDDVEGGYHRALERVPGLAERVGRGRREEPFVGTGDLPTFFRRPHGPGWALVGDAGYHADPWTTNGITNGLRDAELLAEALDAGFSGRRPLGEALADYERRRNEAAMPVHELTCLSASPGPRRPWMRRLLAALRRNQAETDRFIGTIAGTVPTAEFFAPENVRRIVAARPGAAPNRRRTR